jgi:hypothetical protein
MEEAGHRLRQAHQIRSLAVFHSPNCHCPRVFIGPREKTGSGLRGLFSIAPLWSSFKIYLLSQSRAG